MRLEHISAGLILILVGAAFLLNTLGLLTWDIWASFGRFWPVFVIALGVSFLTGRRIPTGLVMILAIAVILALGYVAGYGRGTSGFDSWGRDSWIGQVETETKTISEPLGATAQRGEVKLDFEAARLSLQGGATGFLEGEVEIHRGRREFAISNYANGSQQLVTVRHRGVRPFGNAGLRWNLKLTDAIPLKIDVDVGALDGYLDLSALQVETLNVNTGAGDLKVSLGARYPDVNVNIDAGAAQVTLGVPETAGLRIEIDQGLGTSNVASLGLTQEGDYWATPDFASAATKITIDVDTGAGRVQIDRIP